MLVSQKYISICQNAVFWCVILYNIYVALVSQKHISICQNAVFWRVILCNMSRDLDKISGNIKREEKRKIFAI